jgi:hypothetical protein
VHYDRTIGDICGKNMANTQNLFSDIECRARSVFISPMEHIANMAIASPASDYYFEPLEEEFELRDKTTTKVYSEYGSGDSYRALCKGVRELISADAKPFPYSVSYDDSTISKVGHESLCPLYGISTTLTDPKRSQEEYIHLLGFAPELTVRLIYDFLFHICFFVGRFLYYNFFF